jgi:hypothetical protein
MRKLKYVKLFEMFNPQFGYGRANRPEGYSGDEWYEKIREYEKYIWSIRREAESWIKKPEEVFSEEFIRNHTFDLTVDGNTSGGLYVLKPDTRAMIYFDNLDQEKEKEIIEKAKEIKEYTKIGHDPAWIISMNKLLGELSHQMFAFREEGTFRENKYGSKFYNKEKETWIPYEYKKPILRERPF